MSNSTSNSESPFYLSYKYNVLCPFFLLLPTQWHHGHKHFLSPHIFLFAHMAQGDSLVIVVSSYGLEESENTIKLAAATPKPPRPRSQSPALAWEIVVDLALPLFLAKQPQTRPLMQNSSLLCWEQHCAALSFCSPTFRRGWDVLRNRRELEPLV